MDSTNNTSSMDNTSNTPAMDSTPNTANVISSEIPDIIGDYCLVTSWTRAQILDKVKEWVCTYPTINFAGSGQPRLIAA
jgi:hypothetical protein